MAVELILGLPLHSTLTSLPEWHCLGSDRLAPGGSWFFKKIRDTKGTFHAKMGLIKDRNGMDLMEAEDIKKRWQEYTDNTRPR